MASITKLTRKKGIVFKAVVRLAGHPTHSESFSKLSEAQAWSETVEEALRNGGWIGVDPPLDKDFCAALDQYLVTVSVQKKENSRDRDNISEKPLRRFFKGMTLATIKAEHVARYRDMRNQTVSASTIQK